MPHHSHVSPTVIPTKTDEKKAEEVVVQPAPTPSSSPAPTIAADFLPEATFTVRQQAVAQINNNISIRTITRIMVNGRESLGNAHPFPFHEPLLQKMGMAFKEQKYELFLEVLLKYLQQIPAFTPHCGRAEQAFAMVKEVEALMYVYSFHPVASRIMSILYNPA